MESKEWYDARFVPFSFSRTNECFPSDVAFDIQNSLTKQGFEVDLEKVCFSDNTMFGPGGAVAGGRRTLYRVWVCWRGEAQKVGG